MHKFSSDYWQLLVLLFLRIDVAKLEGWQDETALWQFLFTDKVLMPVITNKSFTYSRKKTLRCLQSIWLGVFSFASFFEVRILLSQFNIMFTLYWIWFHTGQAFCLHCKTNLSWLLYYIAIITLGSQKWNVTYQIGFLVWTLNGAVCMKFSFI